MYFHMQLNLFSICAKKEEDIVIVSIYAIVISIAFLLSTSTPSTPIVVVIYYIYKSQSTLKFDTKWPKY